MSDLIYRHEAIKTITSYNGVVDKSVAKRLLIKIPSAFPDRYKSMKPKEAIDSAWGISVRQAVCPNCDYFLGQVHFLGDGKKKVTYCEHCGQAIDWSEWKEDESE